MPSQKEEAGHQTAREPALSVLLERALGGDDQALAALLGVLRSKYGRRILGNLRRFRRQAHTQTLEDVLQDSMIELLRRVREGELGDLPGQEQDAIVRYFQWICDGKLANAVRARKSPIFARNKPEVPETVRDQKAVVPGEDPEEAEERHRALLGSAIRRLDSTERVILERFLSGVPYSEIAKEVGKSEQALWLVVHHAKRKLLLDIAPGSPTAKLQLERLEEARRRVPTLKEVRGAVEGLPPELRRAVSVVHLDGGSLDQLARELGDRGYDKAQARLKTAYRSLAGKLRVPFPDTFEKLPR
jgi:RNA polymerase sigma factor (sigma-70 family)